MGDVHVVCSLDTEIVGELILLELKVHLHAAIGRLDFNLLAILVPYQEHHVVEEGVLVAIDVVTLSVGVQGVYKGVVVVILARRGYCAHDKLGICRDGGRIRRLGSHFDKLVLVDECLLCGLGWSDLFSSLLALGSNDLLRLALRLSNLVLLVLGLFVRRLLAFGGLGLIKRRVHLVLDRLDLHDLRLIHHLCESLGGH